MAVYAYRVKPGDMRDGAPIHGNTRLEVIWVTIRKCGRHFFYFVR